MDEYAAMFELSRHELDSRILGCADGPASFNAEMHSHGRTVISVDPIYRCSREEIRGRIDKTYPTIMEQLRQNHDDYVWGKISSPEALGQLRMRTMDRFLVDFPQGVKEGRYLPCELPALPFTDQAFSLAVCSHFLFLYSDQLSSEFHDHSVQEMLRVAREVRVFPLLTLGRQASPHLDVICEQLRKSGRACEIKKVDYEFQRGGNHMLRIW
ncbi:MAG: SAM-dependent methyltransferase [bacterium]